MFERFRIDDFQATGATIRFRRGGDGPPLLLLHGNPLTHVSWHKIADRLAERFTVLAADLRGYGDSSCPDDPGENWSNHSFRAMAQDQLELMEHLGYHRFDAAGHDRGARTIHRMALDHPDRIYGDVLEVWCRYAGDVRGQALDCGHYVPEEAPDAVYEAFLDFFGHPAPATRA